jgi:hypothetical protein
MWRAAYQDRRPDGNAMMKGGRAILFRAFALDFLLGGNNDALFNEAMMPQFSNLVTTKELS